MLRFFENVLFRLRGTLRQRRLYSDFEEEMRTHVSLLTEENARRGLSPEAARTAALVKFGGMAQVQEMHRDIRSFPLFESFVQDARYAARQLSKHAGFTVSAVFTLALGVALNTTVFSVYEAVALRALPVRNADEVMRLSRPAGSRGVSSEFTMAQYETMRRISGSGEDLIAVTAPVYLSAEGVPIQAQFVSPNYFRVLRIAPDPAGDQVVLSARYAANGAARDKIRIGGYKFSVTGTAPRTFGGTGSPPVMPDVWLPMETASKLAPGLHLTVNVLFRQTGQIIARVPAMQRALNMPLTAAKATYFDRWGGGYKVFLAVIAVLMIAVMGVLSIAAVNLACLALARAFARQRELAVRTAMGATRSRILRQICVESVALGAVGAGAGFILSGIACRGLSAFLETRLKQFGSGVFLDLTPDLTVFAYALCVSVLTAVAAGMWPALRVTGLNLSGALKGEARDDPRGSGRLRDALIAVQICVCLILLTGAARLALSMRTASEAEAGFDARNSWLMYIPETTLGATPAERGARVEAIASALRRDPGVESAALAAGLPMLGHSSANFEPLDSPVRELSPESHAFYNFVSADYFRTLGIPVRQGRGFGEREAQLNRDVVVVNERAAEVFWPGRQAAGQRISVWKGMGARIGGRTFTVTGVVKRVRSIALSKQDLPYLYFPGTGAEAPFILLRGARSGVDMAGVLRNVGGLDSTLVSQAVLLNVDAGPLALQRSMTAAPALLTGALGLLGLVLSAVGIYGVVAYVMSRRTREIGIRIALGAGKGEVMRLVSRQMLRPMAWGIPAGAAGSVLVSLGLARLASTSDMPDLIYGANPWHPGSFVLVLTILVGVVAAAVWRPARRATRVDPALVLRCD